jgi:outer membrane protein OmpA-like peptidoglycan-associated protein
MKKIYFSILAMVIFSGIANAQGHYTSSGGLVGGANYSSLRIGENTGGLDSKSRWGFAGGLYFGFPIGNTLTIQPEILYSEMGGKITTGNAATDYEQKIGYISVPLLLKIHLGKAFAFVLGPQFDINTSAERKSGSAEYLDNSGTVEAFNLAGTAGLEIMPRGKVSVMFRYIYGFDNAFASSPPELFNQGIQGTIRLKLFGRYEAPPPPPPPPPPLDSDSDGINDNNDKCPTVAGIAKYDGCPIPDTDKDGVNDEEDKCPSEAGLVKYSGCPIPDTDKDGINDEEDKCPTVAGLAKYAGCPVPDTDADSINDEEDKCPTIAGVRENGGCPAIPKFNAADIQFITGSAKPTSKAVKELGDMLDYLNKYPEIKLTIEGHTDDVGKPESNQSLSQKRAEAVKAAIVKKGISEDRITAVGFGMDQPIADNKTAAGKAKNRRVEFKFNQ